MRVLVVDDDASIRRLLRVTLAELGTVVEAADGFEAWDIVAASRPDVVILDVMLPGATGINLLSRWRHDPELQDLPVVLLTALDDPLERRAGTAAGADAYLIKPFASEALVAVVERVLGRRGIPAGTLPFEDEPDGEVAARR